MDINKELFLSKYKSLCEEYQCHICTCSCCPPFVGDLDQENELEEHIKELNCG